MARAKLKTVEPLVTKIRIGNGEEPGFAKLTINELQNLPENSVEIIYVAGIFHRLEREARYDLMNLAWKLLKSGGQIMIVVPYWNTRRYIADPLSKWPPICEESFYVYSAEWRKNEGGEIADLSLICDFTHKTPTGMIVIPAGHEP